MKPTTGFAWATAARNVRASVELKAIRTYCGGRQSQSAVVARSRATTSVTRDGNDLTIRFVATIPLIDTSEGQFSWNVQLETRTPKYRATLLIDVA